MARFSFLLFVAGVALSGLWLYLCYAYIESEVGFETLGYLAPSEIFLGVTALATPLIVIWLVLLYLERSGQLSAETEALQKRLQALTYPEDGAEGRVAEITRSLLKQAEVLKVAGEEALVKVGQARESLALENANLKDLILTAGREADRLRSTLMEESAALGEEGARALEAIERARGPFQHHLQASQEMTERLGQVADAAARALDEKIRALSAAGESAGSFEAAAQRLHDETLRLDASLEKSQGVAEAIARQIVEQERAAERVLEASRSVETTIAPASVEFTRIGHELVDELHRLTPLLDQETQRLQAAGQMGAATIQEAARRSEAAAGFIREAASTLTQSTGQANDATAALALNLEKQTHALATIVNDMGGLGEGVLRLLNERSHALLETGRGAEAAALALVEGLSPRVRELDRLQDQLTATLKEGESGMTAAAELTARMSSTALAALSELKQELEDGFKTLRLQIEALKQEADAAAQRFEETARLSKESGREEFLRAATGIVERLSDASVDLHRLLAQEPSEELFRRFKAGDKGVFARRLIRLKDDRAVEVIKRRYRGDGEFRTLVDRFTKDYETLLEEAAKADPAHTLSAIFMTADVGRLYLMLSRIVGKGS